MIGQGDLFGAPPLRAEASQWHTPPWLARRLAAWVPSGARVLEPSCGGGNLIAALLERGHHPHLIAAVELDPTWAQHCRSRFQHLVLVHTGDFFGYRDGACVSAATPDVVLGNFPFEDNAHLRFTLRALELAPLVIGVFPASFEFSAERDRELWSTKGRVVRRARLPLRVDYGGDQSPKFDTVCLKIARRTCPRQDGGEVVTEEVWLP